MKQQLFWFLLVLTGANILYTLLVDDSQSQGQVPSLELEPDFVAHHLTRTHFDQEGNRTGTIKAAQMAQFEQLGQMQLEAPVYTIYEQHLAKWHISSQLGVLYPDDKVILDREVLLQNLQSGEMFSKMQTSHLEYIQDQQIFQTDDQVTIYGDGFSVHGKGVKIELATQKLQLKQHKGTVYRNE